MSLDKKAILKEIEVLIRSIKVHYDNIENEHRIPTIELELITSKIRKLHEKSIIYNHLHYIEEEQLQSAKRMKFDHLIMKHAEDHSAIEEINIEPKRNEIFNTHVKFEEKVSILEKEDAGASQIDQPVLSDVSSAGAIEAPKIVEEIKVTAPQRESIPTSSFNPIKLSNKIGINDRFRFIKNLFGGNGAAMEDAIKSIENCNSQQALNDCLNKLKSSNQWNEEEDTVIDFMGLVK